MFMNKRFYSLMMCIVLFLLPIASKVDINAVANIETDVAVDEVTVNDLKIYANDIKKYVEGFVNQIETSKKVTVDTIVPIYNNDDQIIGCCVSLEAGGDDYGYVNLDFRFENIITDFSVAFGASSPIESISEDIQEDTEDYRKIDTNKLYKLDLIDYGVGYVDSNNRKRYMVGTNDMSDREF